MDQTAETAAKPAYKRILLKLSGEALMGEDSFGINRTVLARMVEEIKSVVELGVQVGIVVGGGNIFRGVALGATGMDRATGDYMGMLATVMNAMALQDASRLAFSPPSTSSRSPSRTSAARPSVIFVSAAW